MSGKHSVLVTGAGGGVGAATARQFGSFRGLPTTFIVGPEGRIQAQHAGLLTPEAMQEYRRKILDDTSGS